MEDTLFMPQLSITPSRLCAYMLYIGPRKPSVIKLSGSQVREGQQYISAKSSSRLRRAIELLVYTSPWKKVYCRSSGRRLLYRVNFITLTLSSKQCHPDKTIVAQLLSPFLEAWAKRRPGLLFVWKAEVQDNGNIHFHITANAFYHHKKLRADWNRYQDRLGYVARSGLDNPNSTDVHACKSASNLASYLASYVTKKDLHTKVLKRYLSRYRKYLSDQSLPYISLPRNYFHHIKRHVTCARWSGSKALLGAKITADGHDTDIKKLMSLLSHKSVPWIDLDQCRLLYMDMEATRMLQPLHSRIVAAFPKVWAAQARIPYHTEIEAL